MAEHTGGMIALLPTLEDAQRYALDGDQAEPPDQMHVTLQYLGDDVTGWDDEQRARALNVAEKAVSDLGAPLQARVFAHATFNPDGGPGGDRDPCAVYLVGDSDQIGPLHQQVSLTCRALLGDQHPAQHLPFHAHMTAGYGLTAADLTEVGPITFDRVGLFLGDERTELPLTPGGLTPSEAACRAWVRGYGTTGQQITEVAAARCFAVQRAAEAAPDDIGDAYADGVTAGLVTSVSAQRDQVHDTARDALAAVLLAFAAGASIQAVRDAVAQDASRDTRKDQATNALLGQVANSPARTQWQAVVRNGNTIAATAGAAAAAHLLSGGGTPLAPQPSELPNLINPDPLIERQIQGLGGDLAAVLHGDLAADVTDAELMDLLEVGAGAQYWADLQTSQAYLDGMTAMYSAQGTGLLAWRTAAAADVCPTCLGYEARSPYTAATVPQVPHGGCRCVITTWP